MSRIGGGQPPKPDAPPEAGVSKTETTSKAETGASPARPGPVTQRIVDTFQRAQPSLENQLQQLPGVAAGKATAKVGFSSAELGALAQAFAAILRSHPQADRKLRAQLFARTVLKKGRLRRLLADASETELEKMFEVIADHLESSPRWAQLVDDVSENAKKLS